MTPAPRSPARTTGSSPLRLVHRLRRGARRRVLAHRRGLAAALVLLAVATGLRAQAAPAPPTVPVLVAAHDLTGGSTVSADDLTVRRFRPGTVPRGAIPDTAAAVGRTTVTPVRAGEPITDVRLLAPSMLTGYPGDVAAPVRIGDPAAAALLHVGDRVDVLATDPQGDGEAVPVAEDAVVLAVPRHAGRGVEMTQGALVVLAVPEATARRLSGAGVTAYLSVTWNR